MNSNFSGVPIGADVVKNKDTRNIIRIMRFLFGEELRYVYCYDHGFVDGICVDGFFAQIGYGPRKTTHPKEIYALAWMKEHFPVNHVEVFEVREGMKLVIGIRVSRRSSD